MQDDADEQRVCLVDPVPEIAELALRVHENVRNVLDIPHLTRPAPHFHQRIEMRRGDIGRIEPQTMREFRAPAGGQLPVLALDVMHQD